METQARYTIVGLFTLAVVAAGRALVFWLHGFAAVDASAIYRIRFEAPVIGPRPGVAVLFNVAPRPNELKPLEEDNGRTVCPDSCRPNWWIVSRTPASRMSPRRWTASRPIFSFCWISDPSKSYSGRLQRRGSRFTPSGLPPTAKSRRNAVSPRRRPRQRSTVPQEQRRSTQRSRRSPAI